jgi:hypothetical protein
VFTSQVDGEALYYSYQNYGEKELQRKMQDPIAFVVKLDPDMFHYGIAMKQPDRAEFIRAMKEEVNAHTENVPHWELLPCSKVPEGVKVLDSMWAFHHKRELLLKKSTSGRHTSTSRVGSRRRASTSGRLMPRSFNGF